MKPTVLIAVDHQMFLDGLKAMLSPDYEIAGEACDGNTLVELAMEKKPDVIISDLSMPGISGLNALRELREKGISSKFVLVTMHMEPEYAVEAMDAGAAGYVLKNSAGSELLTAVREALAGGVYITPRIAKEVFEISRQPKKSTDLTPRHREILALLAEGLLAKEIGDRLNISSRTVEYHKYQLMKKLGLRTTADLIHYALKERITGD